MPPLTAAGYALVAITVFMIVVLVMLVVSLVRLGRLPRRSRHDRSEATIMSLAVQEAVAKLRAQERATAARAEASERLAGQIIEGVSAGLIVVDRHEVAQIVNPSAKRILHLTYAAEGNTIRTLLADAPWSGAR
jgi:nitrogen fixation/metabolism regulation signal transduction histidine kinase